MRALLLIGLAACSTVSEPFSETVDAARLSGLTVDVERGDIQVTAGTDDIFVVSGQSTGRGATARGAQTREQGNARSITAQPPLLVVEATSALRRGSVDFDIVAPPVVDLDLITTDGSLTVSEVEGVHSLWAGRIQAVRLRGSATLRSDFGGIDAEIYPYVDGAISVNATSGDVVLRLPYGGNYDLEIWGDPEYDMYVAELGFGGSVAQPGFFSGVVGDGSIAVRITVSGGSVDVLEAF